MGIIRVKKDKNYFAASNEPFNDERLSWEARGVMGYLLSKPEDWMVMFYDLVKRGPAGEHKMRRILKELEEYKYLERHRINKKDEEGKFVWVSIVYETPTIPRLSIDGLSTRGKPRDIVSTESINTEIEEDNNKAIYTELSVAFVNKTKIPELSPNPRKWFEALNRMGEAGVEPCDIDRAIDILRDRDYNIIGLSSVANTAISEMSKRKGKQTEQDRSKYVEGEFAEFIEH